MTFMWAILKRSYKFWWSSQFPSRHRYLNIVLFKALIHQTCHTFQNHSILLKNVFSPPWNLKGLFSPYCTQKLMKFVTPCARNIMIIFVMYLLESNEWCDEVKCISSEVSVSLEFEFSTSSHDKAPILLISWPRNKTRNYIYIQYSSPHFFSPTSSRDRIPSSYVGWVSVDLNLNPRVFLWALRPAYSVWL